MFNATKICPTCAHANTLPHHGMCVNCTAALEDDEEKIGHHSLCSWVQKANTGHPVEQAEAFYRLAKFYHTYGGKQAGNIDYVVYLYRLAAEKGHADAQYMLGLILCTPGGRFYDYEEGKTFLQLSARQGNKKAKYRLKFLNRNPMPLPKTPLDITMDYLGKDLTENINISKGTLPSTPLPFVGRRLHDLQQETKPLPEANINVIMDYLGNDLKLKGALPHTVPFFGRRLRDIQRHLNGLVPETRDLPPALADIVLECLKDQHGDYVPSLVECNKRLLEGNLAKEGNRFLIEDETEIKEERSRDQRHPLPPFQPASCNSIPFIGEQIKAQALKLLPAFIQHVMARNLTEVESILRVAPWLTRAGVITVTDPITSDSFDNLTVLQYACCEIDVDMCEIVLRYLPTPQAVQQLNELKERERGLYRFGLYRSLRLLKALLKYSRNGRLKLLNGLGMSSRLRKKWLEIGRFQAVAPRWILYKYYFRSSPQFPSYWHEHDWRKKQKAHVASLSQLGVSGAFYRKADWEGWGDSFFVDLGPPEEVFYDYNKIEQFLEIQIKQLEALLIEKLHFQLGFELPAWIIRKRESLLGYESGGDDWFS